MVGVGFGFQGVEESSGQELGCGLDHALAYAGDQAPDIYVAGILNVGGAIFFGEVESARAFYKAWLAFAFDYKREMLRRHDVFKSNRGSEDALYRTNACGKRGLVLVFAGLFHLLAARDTFL